MTTLDQVAASREVQENFPALAEAAHSVGDAQIRNWQRIGDPFAYRDLACDLPAVALALEATFQTVGVSGSHAMGAEEFLRLAVQAQWMPHEIVSSIDFPACAPGTGTAYQSLRHPASTLAICGVAALVAPSANQVSVGKCRVAVTGALSYPIRLPKVEAALEGKAPTAENMAAAAKLAAENAIALAADREGITILSDLYASAEYRTHLISVLTKRALTEATKRAKFGA
jgi:carbon-monoxide dehydrogenase medium subunit